jgi:predicted ArsR family transcriptional regulator
MHTSEDRILLALKSKGALSTQALARQIDLSLAGARKHLLALSQAGLVASAMVASGVGRPKRVWRLTDKAQSRFPDSHVFLTVEMIDAVRGVFGGDGLERLIGHREQASRRRYRAAMNGARTMEEKLTRLCRLRTEEGYMAQWSAVEGDTFLLVENHCPICAAARSCQGFCRSELDLFSAVLGSAASIERTEHILTGARRCAYRIVARP